MYPGRTKSITIQNSLRGVYPWNVLHNRLLFASMFLTTTFIVLSSVEIALMQTVEGYDLPIVSAIAVIGLFVSVLMLAARVEIGASGETLNADERVLSTVVPIGIVGISALLISAVASPIVYAPDGIFSALALQYTQYSAEHIALSSLAAFGAIFVMLMPFVMFYQLNRDTSLGNGGDIFTRIPPHNDLTLAPEMVKLIENRFASIVDGDKALQYDVLGSMPHIFLRSVLSCFVLATATALGVALGPVFVQLLGIAAAQPECAMYFNVTFILLFEVIGMLVANGLEVANVRLNNLSTSFKDPVLNVILAPVGH